MRRFLALPLLLVLAIGADGGVPDARKSPSSDYQDGDKHLRLVVLEGLEVVRGILVGPWSGGDSRELHREAWYGKFLHLHGFAFLGATGFYGQDYKVVQAALAKFARDSKPPELVHAPFVATDFSAGGGFARRLVSAAPTGSSLRSSSAPP